MDLMSSKVDWFIGVVEDRMDPYAQGRVRVRVVGVHPFKKAQDDIDGMPIEDLPWMSVVLPVTSAGQSGVGGSITGLVEGSHVFGFWLDKYRTNGIVLGATLGAMTKKPNPDEGFSDPNGQYPRVLGSGTNPLNEGGSSGTGSDANTMQDSNLGTGVNPSGGNGSPGEDNNSSFTIQQMLKNDEGVRTNVYWDIFGRPHTGIGHLIIDQKTKDLNIICNALDKQVGRSVSRSRPSITQEEVAKLFNSDLNTVQSGIRKYTNIATVYNSVNRPRQMALENMAFQLGVPGLAKFKNMLSYMKAGKWEEAYKQCQSSLWYKQTPGRAKRVAQVILYGNFTSYGIKVSTPPKSRLMSVTASVSSFSAGSLEDGQSLDSIDLSQNYVEDDSPILFTEPASSYNGQYPFVHATETEAGHVQEFDDTPGNERYRYRHPSGSYTEIAADGRKTEKATGDSYQLTNGTHHLKVEGDHKVNIGGDEVFYNMGNVRNQIDGNCDLYVKGNETKIVDGNGTITVKGNVTVIVEGNATVQVNGNAETTVQGDHKLNVSGNLDWTIGGNVTQSVSGTWKQTMSSMDSNASGNYKINGSRVDLG